MFKKTLLAAAFAAFVAQPASAGVKENGMVLNGIQINGIQINGIQINGTDAAVSAPTVHSVTLPSGVILPIQ